MNEKVLEFVKTGKAKYIPKDESYDTASRVDTFRDGNPSADDRKPGLRTSKLGNTLFFQP